MRPWTKWWKRFLCWIYYQGHLMEFQRNHHCDNNYCGVIRGSPCGDKSEWKCVVCGLVNFQNHLHTRPLYPKMPVLNKDGTVTIEYE